MRSLRLASRGAALAGCGGMTLAVGLGLCRKEPREPGKSGKLGRLGELGTLCAVHDAGQGRWSRALQCEGPVKPAKRKLTVADLLALKGKRPIVLTTAFDEWTARAAEQAGVDMIVAWGSCQEHSKFVVEAVRRGAPNTLIGTGINPGAYESQENALKLANEMRAAGTDIIYCSGLVPEKFAGLAKQHFPCCGHVGYLPANNTWFGGPRAVGKTAEEARKVYEDVMALEVGTDHEKPFEQTDADALSLFVEMECVPAKVAAEITKRTKMLVFSMGSGPDCDGQFIFSEDLIGTNSGHYPRHSITYANLMADAVRALSQYCQDVRHGAYPAAKHCIKMKDEEFLRFKDSLS